MQRRKKPDTEIGKGMRRFEPNAERKETKYKDRKKKCRDLNQMQREKKPNAEREENKYRDRKRNAEI
jgi:hypothetical protein